MKISLEWLSAFVTWTETDPRVIAERLTRSVAEVEDIHEQGALLHHCCVGRVVRIAKHPDADRLSVVEVETDTGSKTVVCGGTNLTKNMLVAFAHIGARVQWHGEQELTELKPVKIRGVQSEGMICAAEELAIEDVFPPRTEDGERPIVDLTNTGVEAGQPLREALGRTDTVLDINNTAITMRPDLFSQYGFARECVAIGLAEWKKPKPEFRLPKAPRTAPPFTVQMQSEQIVQRYVACVLHAGEGGETPLWMKRRLEATGWRSVNLPVDITNYVFLESGMPLHAFDADAFKGNVELRFSKKDETLTTLDGQKHVLADGIPVIGDEKGVVDLLGIMGGKRVACTHDTRTIYLHAAVVDPVLIRKAILATGIRTEAATVYEKGVQAVTAEQGFARAVQLFLELCPDASLASAIDSRGGSPVPPTIALSPERVRRMIGDDISEQDMKDALERVECSVDRDRKRSMLRVTPPRHRLRDLAAAHDLVEEIARIRGYDSVPDTLPRAPLRLPARDTRTHAMRDALRAKRYCEILPLTFLSPSLLERSRHAPADAVAVSNPLGEETSLLLPSTLPHLLAHAEAQRGKSADALRTFHLSRVFHKDETETLELGLLFCASANTDLKHSPLLTLRTDLASVLHAAGYDVTVRPTDAVPPFAHPGRVGGLFCEKKEIGIIAEIHPAVRDAFHLTERAACVLLNMDALHAIAPATVVFHPLPRFPAVLFDETVQRTLAESIGPLLADLSAQSSLLEDIDIIDLYDGPPLQFPHYNVTLRFTYRSSDRTLTEDEAKKAHAEVMKLLAA